MRWVRGERTRGGCGDIGAREGKDSTLTMGVEEDEPKTEEVLELLGGCRQQWEVIGGLEIAMVDTN